MARRKNPRGKTESMNAETVAERIRRLRLARALTQEGLARELAVAVATVARWENDKRTVLPMRVYRRPLAEALGVSVDLLMTGAERESTAAGLRPRLDRRQPVLAPLRALVGRLQSMGEDVVADFVTDVVALAQEGRWTRKPRR